MSQREKVISCGLDCDRLGALADFCGQFSRAGSVREICRNGLDLLKDRLGYEQVSIVLYDTPLDSKVPFYGFNVSSPIETKEALDTVRGAVSEGSIQPWKEVPGRGLYIPLVNDTGREIGFLSIGDGSAGNEENIQLLRIVSSTISNAIISAQTELQYKRNVWQHRILIDSLPAYIYIKDERSRFLVCNAKQVLETGAGSSDEMLGKTDFDFYPKELAQKYFDDEQRLIQSGEPLINIEEECRNKDGSSSWLLTTKIPLKDEDGTAIGLVGIGLDITEQKRYQQQVWESEECYRTLFESINDAVLVHDAEGRILDSNDAAPVLFECSSDELLQRSVAQLNLPDYANLLESGNLDGCGLNERLQMKQGVELYLDIKASAINYRGTAAYLVLFRDVTELNDAREKAERSAQAKSAFLANMSHEIRTPLNAVVGMSGLLLDTPLTEEQRDFASTIMTSSDALLGIVNDILDLSKIEAGKFELESVPFNLVHAVEKSVDVLASKAAEKGLELMQYFSGAVPEVVVGDEPRLRQVLLNLLSNAIKFTPAGEVLVEVDGRRVHDEEYRINFAVSDTGIGMTQDEASRVFQPFEQADTSITRKYGGTGLGLTICNRLVQMMGGEMTVRSEKGAGSEFRFHIVLRRSDDKDLAEVDFDVGCLKDRRVLVVDDNQTNLRILKHELTKCQMEPVLFSSGPVVLENLESLGRLDIAVLDFTMPEMDGCTLADELRKRPEFGNRPILVLSSSGRPSTEAANNINRWLSKPVKAHRLQEALASLLGGTRENLAEKRLETPSWHDLAGKFPLKILLAEDNKVNQKVALKTLKKMGYDADLAENGAAAADAALNNRYDLVLMDIQMPIMDGLEATRLIFEKLKGRALPSIVGLSAHALEESRNEALAEGMCDYLNKPVKIEELVKVLERVYTSRAQAK